MFVGVWVLVVSVVRVPLVLFYDSNHTGAFPVQQGMVFVYFCVSVVMIVRPAVYTFKVRWLGFAVLQIVITCT
jgi:hypothetical protein